MHHTDGLDEARCAGAAIEIARPTSCGHFELENGVLRLQVRRRLRRDLEAGGFAPGTSRSWGVQSPDPTHSVYGDLFSPWHIIYFAQHYT